MQKTTLFLVLVALGLGGYVYFYELQANPPQEETVETDSEEGLLPFEASQVEAITIKKEAGETLKFIRLETVESSWRMKRPEGFPAEESAIAFLLDLLIQDSNPKTFTVEWDEIEAYGLKTPFSTIEIELNNNTTHRILLGNPTFDQEQIYAQINPLDNPQPTIYILPIDFKYAVERPLSQWKQPLPPDFNPEETETNESQPSDSEETETNESQPSDSSTEEEE